MVEVAAQRSAVAVRRHGCIVGDSRSDQDNARKSHGLAAQRRGDQRSPGVVDADHAQLVEAGHDAERVPRGGHDEAAQRRAVGVGQLGRVHPRHGRRPGRGGRRLAGRQPVGAQRLHEYVGRTCTTSTAAAWTTSVCSTGRCRRGWAPTTTTGRTTATTWPAAPRYRSSANSAAASARLLPDNRHQHHRRRRPVTPSRASEAVALTVGGHGQRRNPLPETVSWAAEAGTYVVSAATSRQIW